MLICSHLFWYHVGLKIQSLRLEEREAAAKEEASADDDDAAGNGNGANDGPWKKIETAPVASDDHTEVVSEAKEVITYCIPWNFAILFNKFTCQKFLQSLFLGENG